MNEQTSIRVFSVDDHPPRSERLDEKLIDVAPAPLLAGFERLDDGVTRLVEVFRRVTCAAGRARPRAKPLGRRPPSGSLVSPSRFLTQPRKAVPANLLVGRAEAASARPRSPVRCTR